MVLAGVVGVDGDLDGGFGGKVVDNNAGFGGGVVIVGVQLITAGGNADTTPLSRVAIAFPLIY
jgi:hypothetical protein